MIKHIFRAAFKEKELTITSIAGLAIGLAAAMFLLTHLVFEHSYDKHHSKIDRIYRTLSVWKEAGQDGGYHSINLRALKEKLEVLPEVEKVSQLYDYGTPIATKANGEMAELGRTMMVDPSFYAIFDAKLVAGELSGKTLQPNTLVLVKSEAEKLFGRQNPIGKTLVIDKKTCTITAVVEDQPINTMFRYKVLFGMHPEIINRLQGLELPTYVLFKKGVNIPEAIKKCNKINTALLTARFEDANAKFSSEVEPFSSVHIKTKAGYDLIKKVNRLNLLFLMIVVLFILGIAITNFINLSIIKGERRAKEISIRKANGANRANIVRMLLVESFVVTLISFLIAFVLLYLLGDYISSFLNIKLPPNFLLNPTFYPWIAAVFLFVVATSSVYPSLYLSKSSPIELLRNSVKRRHRLTISSVVLQFTAVVFCLISIIVVATQLQFEKALPLGYVADNVYTVDLPEKIDQTRLKTIIQDLTKNPAIVSASASDHFPFTGCSGQGVKKLGESISYSVDERRCDASYFDTYKIKILEGRTFTGNESADSSSIILSQNAIKTLNLKNPIGTTILLNDKPMLVIGITRDIRYGSARYSSGVDIYNNGWGSFNKLSILVSKGQMDNAPSYIKATLTRHLGAAPVSLERASDYISKFYNNDQSMFNIIASGAGMAILLALMGLVALSRFVAKQKEKEMAVRKVIGATLFENIWAMSRYIMVRIIPAIPLGGILAYFAMHSWLMDFTFRIEMKIWMFAAAITITLLLGLTIIILQTFRTAMVNPSSILRKE